MTETKQIQWPPEWAGKTWKSTLRGEEYVITEDDLRRLYDAVPAGKKAMLKALDVTGFSSRKGGRALELLKSKKLIHYVAGIWKHV